MDAFLTFLARYDGNTLSLKHALELAGEFKYTGPLTIHFRGGIAQSIEAGRPIQQRVCSELPFAHETLDNRPGTSAGL